MGNPCEGVPQSEVVLQSEVIPQTEHLNQIEKVPQIEEIPQIEEVPQNKVAPKRDFDWKEGVKYVIKQITNHPLRFGSSYNANFLDGFQLSIGEEGIVLFRQIIFGPYLDIHQCNFQGHITKCLLLLELEQNNKGRLVQGLWCVCGDTQSQFLVSYLYQ